MGSPSARDPVGHLAAMARTAQFDGAITFRRRSRKFQKKFL
jgi:hypothetical protein